MALTGGRTFAANWFGVLPRDSPYQLSRAVLETVCLVQMIGPFLGCSGHFGIEGERGHAVFRAVGVEEFDGLGHRVCG